MPLDPSSSGAAQCPNCGAPLPEQAPQGLCPRCLFAGLAVPTEGGAGAAAQVPSQTPEELAPHFPQLEILECLGRGGMGVVYKARQKSLNRVVALKLLAPERVTDAKFAERFTHEAQALAALNHPNIVTIHDFGQAGGFYFLLMEFVDGVNLRQAMKAGRFTPEQALAIVPPVCEALQYAHEHGIVHRDIKPENLLLDKEGRVKIADFGIAKMLGNGTDTTVPDEGLRAGTHATAAGTPQYMAPEQKEHRVADHRADIYSLGVVLYEMLTGELPAEKLQPPSRKVQIDVRLDEIVLRALEKTPELRFATAAEFRTQVETLTTGAKSAAAPAASVSEFADKSGTHGGATRHATRLLGVALLVTGLVLGGLLWFEEGRAHNAHFLALSREIPKLQQQWTAAGTEAFQARTALSRFEVNAATASTDAERQENEIERRRLAEKLAQAEKLSAELQARIPAATEAVNQLRFPSPGLLTKLLLTAVPFLLIGLTLLFWRHRSVPGQPAGRGATAAALGIIWWFAAFPLVAYFAAAIRAKEALSIAVMLIALPFVAMLARRKAEQWCSAHDGGSGPRWLRAFSWLGWLLAVVAVGLALFFFYSLMTEIGSWNPAPSEGAVAALDFLGIVLLPWAAAHLWRAAGWKAGMNLPPPMPPVRAPFKYAGLLVLLIPVLLIGLLFVKFVAEVRSPSGVTSFDIKAVEVHNNVVIVDVTTEVARGNAELRAVLEGRDLPAVTEAALAEMFFPPFTGTFIKPAPHGGNHPWFILSPGRQTRRLGFVLPDAEAAKVAFDNIHPIGPLPAVADRTFAGTLFALRQNDDDYRASLQVAPPFTAANPNWVAVSGLSQHNESAVTLTWEVLASQPGMARLPREKFPIIVLKRNPESELYGVSVQLELTRIGPDRVRIDRRMGHGSSRAEFPGNFRELADELLRTRTHSAKTESGKSIELCQVQGKPLVVQLDRTGPPAASVRHAAFGINLVAISLVFLLIVAAGIVLAIVLVRKGVSAGSIVLWVIGLPLLVLVIAFAVIFFVRSSSRDFRAATEASATLEIPQHRIDLNVLRVENPPGTRDILLHFERDTNYGLGIEVWQDVTASPDGKMPIDKYRDARQKTWVGLGGGRVLAWTLPREFTETQAGWLAKEMEQKWKGAHPLPDGAVPEFATVVHRDGWKYHLAARVLREPGSPRPPAPDGAMFTAEQRFIVPADALVRVTLDQSTKDGPKTQLGESLVFKTASNRATGFVLRWHAYPAQQEKFGNQWILDLVDPDTGVIFHRIENSFAVPVKLTSPDVPPLPNVSDAAQLGDTRMSASFQLLRAEEHTAPGAALTAWWDIFAGVELASDRPVPAFQMAQTP